MRKKEFSLPANSSWLKFFISMYFGRNYFNFNGRASRREFWAVFILGFIFLSLPTTRIMFLYPDYADIIELCYELYVLIPTSALIWRRFHDFDMSPWWSLLLLPLLFVPIFSGDRKDNRYGANIY